jgi:pimeloyl-ACP methyl ester carboxylesterase
MDNSPPCKFNPIYLPTILISYTTFLQTKTNKWVTFVHGAGGSSAIWYKQIKSFNANFNVLLVDLRGHGNSEKGTGNHNYSFNEIAIDIIEVLDKLNIQQSHFVGISLGSIIIRSVAHNNPNRVDKLILAGAIMKLNIRSQILMWIGNSLKSIIPFLLLYKFFAYTIMPRRNHKKSRQMFINEAKKLDQNEFIRWFKLTAEVNGLLKHFRKTTSSIPFLYFMGDQDSMFLPSVKKLIALQLSNSTLIIAPNCGHVVNIDQPEYFNIKSMEYLQHETS